jgi:hypothetical protein
VSFSSGQANLALTALIPKAIGSSSKDMFRAPLLSRAVFEEVFISSRSACGESGSIFTITATIPAIFDFGMEGI